MTLGQYIKKLRNEKDISCEDLSKEVGIDLKMLQDLENDATEERDYNTIYSLTKYFNIKASSFVTVDSSNINLNNTSSIVFSIIETEGYSPSDKKMHIEDCTYLPWKKECAPFIIAATQYKIYFKASKAVTLNSLITAFDKMYTPFVYAKATECFYLPTGEEIYGTQSFYLDDFLSFKDRAHGVISVSIHHKNTVTLRKREKLLVNNSQLETAAFGGGDNKIATNASNEELASIDANIDEE